MIGVDGGEGRGRGGTIVREAVESSDCGKKRGEGEEKSSEMCVFELHCGLVSIAFRAP